MTGTGIKTNGVGQKTTAHLNLDLFTGDVGVIADAAMRGDPAWKIAARFRTNQQRIKDICRIEQVEVKS